ncbi:MAG: phosphopyruvate hydratase [Patescibacteria group bacterium]|nr:phosphopyruvate hydratase [Patescibacteria group bacterium]
MAKIKDIRGRKILDSRANSTLEVDVLLDDGAWGRASVPSGASTGSHEIFKLEDIDKAVENVDILAKSLIGQEASDQEKVDLLMINTDGSPEKQNLGGNVILAISLAVCEAQANSLRLPLYRYIASLYGLKNNFRLPTPLFNVINGGKHADSNLPFQEFMIIPLGQKNFKQKVEEGAMIFKLLKKTLHEMGLAVAVGDEGGFAPRLNSNEEALEILTSTIEKSGLKPRLDMGIGLDVAASSIPDLNPITYPLDPLRYYQKIVNEYPIVYLEDGLGEDDWEGWSKLTKLLGGQIKIVGDDLFTTNPARIERGVREQSANAIIIKPDQIGSLTETLRAIKMAKQAGFSIVVSHRSGETESTFIADLAVGVGAEFIKTGAPSRGERVSKYNQLLRIEEELSI